MEKMKAWILHRPGEISYESTETPRPGEGEVLVCVKAAGVCGSDIPRIYRDGAHKMPLVPGHEFAGEVAELGTGADPKWLHKRVGIYPLIPCRTCAACKRGQYEMCRGYSYLGSRRDGGFAEYVSVPQENLVELPGCVTFEQGAMLEPLAVAVHAMRRFSVSRDDVTAVCGLGTIGMLLTMLLLEQGVRDIFVIGNKASQKTRVQALGIPEKHFLDSREEKISEKIQQYTDGRGIDLFFECVGKNDAISQAVELTAPGGRVCLVGNPDTDVAIEKSIYWKILRNQLTIRGTWNSSFFTGQPADANGLGTPALTDWEYALRLLEEGRIAPQELISHRFGLEQLGRGLDVMRDRSEDHLKVMINFSPGD